MQVLPMVHEVPVRNEPGVLMSILGIHQVALEHKKLGITKEILATQALPFLVPLCIENCLNPQQVPRLFLNFLNILDYF